MKDVILSEDIVPIGEFKSHAAHWLKKLRSTGQPVVITQNGKPAGVLVSPIDFDRSQEKERFLASISKGLVDADEGRTMTADQLKTRLAALSD
ncbi:MAG: type II toxin-antitoxin system Phd/YefM family antitoxin [Alphaproteobacteria bacterium]|nr:type II toxin-antitoxin system Phd/YefM family antitoxin [Alphaproteobacteria bacterium]